MMPFAAKTNSGATPGQNHHVSKSPLLFSILDKIDIDKRFEILETGSASRDSINYLSQYWCKLYITDSMATLCQMNTTELDTPYKLNRALVNSMMLYKNKKASLDCLLFWDLPNYLQPDIFSSLIAYLLPHTNPQAVLHCYLYTSSLMPESPGKYQILENSQIRIENSSSNTRSCPAYYQEALQKLTYPFKVKRSILHSNGLQEYLLAR